MLAINWILLVEDNEDDILLTQRSLAQQEVSVHVVVARDGAEALQILRHGPPADEGDLRALPDLVLLDINLPKLSGLEVLKRFRQEECSSHVPVVMLTTSRDADDVRRSYHSGANSYIRKPVNFQEFQDAVRAIANYWLALNQAFPGSDRVASDKHPEHSC